MAYVISDECTACGTCIDECPVEAITEGDIYVIDPELCTDCAACADVCPVEAISPEQGSQFRKTDWKTASKWWSFFFQACIAYLGQSLGQKS